MMTLLVSQKFIELLEL